MIRPPYLPRTTSTNYVRVSHQDGQMVRVYSVMDDNGLSHLTCECDVYVRRSWCNHVQMIYEGRGESDKLMSTSPAIVVFSRDPWLIVPCLLIPVGTGRDDLWEVRAAWGGVKRIDPTTFKYRGSTVLGYVESTNDKYKQIRNLLLEWLPAVPDVYPDAMACNSFSHAPGDSVLESVGNGVPENDIPAAKRYLADAFNLLDEGKCRACATASFVDIDS